MQQYTNEITPDYAGCAIGMGLCTLILDGATIAVGGAGALACGVILGTTGGYEAESIYHQKVRV